MRSTRSGTSMPNHFDQLANRDQRVARTNGDENVRAFSVAQARPDGFN